MRIGFDAKRIFHNTTGLGNYSRDLVRIMAQYYPDNSYFLYNPKPPKINRLQISGNMKVRQPENFIHKKFPWFWRSKSILKDLQKDQIDIYHGLTGELPFGIDKIPVKSIVTIHDLIFVHYPELYKPIDRKIYLYKFKKAAQIADKVVAISEQTKVDIVKYLKISNQKIEVIYQGCHQVFKEQADDALIDQIKNKYNLPDHFILNVGTIEERKNIFSVVKAIKDTDYQLVIVGRKTPYAQKIETYMEANHMQNQVHFLEGLAIEELAALYQMADIFVYPSIYEGFGIPIIEALYSKTPVITNKYGVFKEAGGAYTYYLEDVKNPLEIKEMIGKIYQNPDIERINNAYEFVQKFNDDKIAAQWQNLYLNLHHKYLV